ncbi:hypothetical protein Tco_1190746 [Tanacetum coccineum]
MTSFDYRLDPIYAIKECSSCGSLYTSNCGCSKGSLEDKILVPIPDSSQRPLKIEKICLDCGDPIHGLYCRGCALIRKTFEEVFQDFQDTSESSDDNTNVVNAPREPFVVKQDPGENSSPSPPHIDHCCHECGDSLDGIFCRQCTCKSCGKGAHYGYNCPPKVPIITNPEPCSNQTISEPLQNLQSLQQQCLLGTCQKCGCNEYDGVCFYCKVRNRTPINFSTPYSSNDSPKFSNHPTHYEPILCEFCGNDARYGHYCTPQDYDEFPQTLPSFQQQSPCCKNCRGPHNGGNCPGCSVIESGNRFVYDQNPYPYHETHDYFNQPPQHQYETYSCEFCSGNSHPGFDYQTGNRPIFDQGPCYNQDFNQPPHYSPSQPQQYLCFEDCEGPHETFQCQPMDYFKPNPCIDSNYSGFDQIEPPQFPVIHQTRQQMSMEVVQARENLMKSIENFLKKFNRISFREKPKVLMQAWDKFLEIKHAQTKEVQDLFNKLIEDVQNINKELAEYTNTPSWNLPTSSYDDDDDEYSFATQEYLKTCSIAITPVLLTRDPVNSLCMGDEPLDTIPTTESDEFIKSSVEILVPIPSESEVVPKMCDVPLCENTTPLNALNEHYEIVVKSDDDNSSSDDDSPYDEDIDYVDASPPDVEIVSLEVVEIIVPEDGRINDDILLTIEDDILREKLLNINLLIAKIDALRDNPTPSSDVVTKSTSTFSNLFLEETNTFDNSIPEFETFRFNLEEISSGSSTTRSDLSLPDYKAFYVDNDHFKEKSSGSTTTHADFSQYDSFIFDLSNDQFPPADRSDFNHEEFADELTHIMPLPELECFKFKIEPDPGDLTSIDPGIRKNASTTNVNVPLEDDQSSLFAYVVWIFLAFLTYPVVPPYLLSTGNEDTIFDPGISI